MLIPNKPAWIEKFKYQLSEKLPYGTFNHIIEQLNKHNGVYGEGYIVKGNNKYGYAVFTEGKLVKKIS